MKNAFVQLHAAVLLASCSGILGNLISLDAVMVTWYRMLLAGLVLMAVLVVRERRPAFGRTDLKVLAVGALLALHWILFYASIKCSNVSVGVVCFCLSGFFTAIISPLLNRRRISWVELLLSSLTLAGILLIFHFDTSFRLGIGLGVVSSLLFALYATLNGRVNSSSPSDSSPTLRSAPTPSDTPGIQPARSGTVPDALRITALQMTGGCAALTVLLPFYHLAVPSALLIPTAADTMYLLLLALGSTVCMCLLLNRAQRTITPFTVSLTFNLEPVYSILLAILIFHEHRVLGPAFWAGLALIVLSLALQMVHVALRKRYG